MSFGLQPISKKIKDRRLPTLKMGEFAIPRSVFQTVPLLNEQQIVVFDPFSGQLP